MAARAGAGRRTDCATPRSNVGAAWVDLQVLLGHVDLATTPIDTHMDQGRMAAAVNKL
jgi:site-specific recombinase XerD